MLLLELPVELLDTIIEFTLPEGLESFALSCRTVYNVGKDHVRAHNVYKQRWTRFRYDNRCNTDHGFKLPMELLVAVYEDPLIASYIQFADFWQKDFDQEQIARRKKRVLGDDTNLAAIGGLLGQSHYLRQANQDPEQWLADMRDEGEDGDEEPETYKGPNYSINMATILLLTLLPNLRELILPNEWQSLPYPYTSRPDEQLWSVLDVITREASLRLSSNASLSRLVTILPYARISYEDRNGLIEMSPFLPIKSVEHMHIANCVAVDDGYEGIPFTWRNTGRSSNLRIVELAGCCINSCGITELVKHTPHLTTLKYSHDVKWQACQYDWDAGNFVRAIEQHCGSTLQTLAVTIDKLRGMVVTGIVSMHGFKCLESVELDIMVFAGPPPDSGKRQGMPGEDYKLDVSHVPRLTDILPRTIKHVKLFIPSDIGEADADIEFDTLASLFRQHATQQPLCQPDMVGLSIGFEHVYSWADEVRRVFDAHSDSRELVPLLDHWQASSTVSQGLSWVEEFRERYGISSH
ncbi:hypothetical protein LTR10_006123 [Elasticomyces elasticus]|nr:hypothetical protein LTR10_006123 [Elasticomyces elasticus]KAK4966826.1 hypothetical protein LTR42_011138 [Elasticomyces elasticus]